MVNRRHQLSLGKGSEQPRGVAPPIKDPAMKKLVVLLCRHCRDVP